MIRSKPTWICNKCGKKEHKEKEVRCWKCGKGEMVFKVRGIRG